MGLPAWGPDVAAFSRKAPFLLSLSLYPRGCWQRQDRQKSDVLKLISSPTLPTDPMPGSALNQSRQPAGRAWTGNSRKPKENERSPSWQKLSQNPKERRGCGQHPHFTVEDMVFQRRSPGRKAKEALTEEVPPQKLRPCQASPHVHRAAPPTEVC